MVSNFSPAFLHAYDSAGNHTGLTFRPDPETGEDFIEEGIPNSAYFAFGESQHITFATPGEYRFVIEGVAQGMLNLEIQKFRDQPVGEVKLAPIPITTGTEVELMINENNSPQTLTIDFEGDGQVDLTANTSTLQSPLVSLDALERLIQSLSVHKSVKQAIANQVKAARKQVKNGRSWVAAIILDTLIKQLDHFPRVIIKREDATLLIRMIEEIRVLLV